MDRQHRHDLKHDKFVDEIGALSSRARDNQRLLGLIAAGVVIVALATYGYFFYRGSRESGGQKLLATAITTFEAPVEGATPDPQQPAPPKPRFKTEQERSAAAEKEFKEIIAKHPGTDAADVAGLYLARIAVGRGDVATARKLLTEFVEDHENHILESTAQYSLYQLRIEAGEGAQVVAELNTELAKPEPGLPGDAILILLAQAYEVQGDLAKSRDTYRRITTEFPESPYAVEAQRRSGQA